MKRHRTDFVALAFGLIFATLAVLLLGGRFEASDLNLALIASWGLGVIGIILGGVALNRHSRTRAGSTERH